MEMSSSLRPTLSWTRCRPTTVLEHAGSSRGLHGGGASTPGREVLAVLPAVENETSFWRSSKLL